MYDFLKINIETIFVESVNDAKISVKHKEVVELDVDNAYGFTNIAEYFS